MKLKLFNEDCISGMAKHLKAKSIDTVVTSPPYNIGVNYNLYDDKMPHNDYLKWLLEWAIEIKRVLKDDGSLFLNIGSKPSYPTMPFEVIDYLTKVLNLQNVIHWIKSISFEENTYGKNRIISAGHYKPINSNRFLNNSHEYIFHLTKTNSIKLDRLAIGVPYKDQSNISRWNNGNSKKRCRGNCWFIPYKTINNRDKDRPHPATFPPKLAEDCIKLHGVNKSTKVLDPFMGLGNTGLACQNLKLNFIGFEIDPYYFKIANEQLALIKGIKK